jgi:hypothetical protein
LRAALTAGTPIQTDIFPRDGVFNRLEMREDGDAAQRRANVAFELFDEVMPALYGPTPRDQHRAGTFYKKRVPASRVSHRDRQSTPR